MMRAKRVERKEERTQKMGEKYTYFCLSIRTCIITELRALTEA